MTRIFTCLSTWQQTGRRAKLASTRPAEEVAQNLNTLARRLTEAVAQYRL